MRSPLLRCQACGKSYKILRKTPWCDCGSVFDLDFPLPDQLRIDLNNFTFWRYSRMLPVTSKVTLGEPITPIVSIEMEQRTVDVKLEYLLPTGSFKDRGAAILVSAMVDAGIDTFMEDSSGNAGAAMAAYAARAGLRCEIYCPASSSPWKLKQIERTGAIIHKIDGPRDKTTEAVRANLGDIFYASHNWHPLFLHGTKTMAYEIAEQYDWNPPSHIVAPTGGGGVLLGLHLGFTELIRLGRVQCMPKLHAVQADACAPLLHADVEPRPSVAEGILTSRPPRLLMLKKYVDSVTTVSEAEILDGFRQLASAGFNAEPTSAVVVPAFARLPIPPGQRTLLILTGLGLKYAGNGYGG